MTIKRVDDVFGIGHNSSKIIDAMCEKYDDSVICGTCGEVDCDCEMCRELSERELRAAMHLANTLKFIELNTWGKK